MFVNGLPLAIIELKNAADADATIWSAYSQLQTYKAEIPSLLKYNELLIVSDGLQARIGSLTANQEWFKVWRTVDGEGDAPRASLELEVLIRGVFEKQRFLDLLQHFIVLEEDTESDRLHKIIAGYHQFHAVNGAVEESVRASRMTKDQETAELPIGEYWAGRMHSGKPGDRRAGVMWHTQGSGKSFSMLFYAARVVRHSAMKNPTNVVLTDRNDLDDQLFTQFQRCHELLNQMPVQARDREHLRELLQVASGGVIFTTIQKFMPAKGESMPSLSERRNITVIADEAHRNQYDLIDGLARNLRDALPHASFIGFTGTPIEQADANTRAIFGDYISIYDIQRAVADGSTVPIYYESRIAKLGLNIAVLPGLDQEFDEITEGEEQTSREKLKSKWAALEALVGHPKRIKLIAADLVEHFEKRLEAMDGKAMVVCMSRRICVDLHNAIIAIRPEWASAEGDDVEAESSKNCVVKVVMTGSAEDGPDWQPHIRNKEKRRTLATRFKDATDPFRIVIVRDMWLTGFDAPCLHTMYADKPMQGHGLMQAIQAALNKQSSGGRKSLEDLDAAVRQLVSKAIVAEGQIIDVFTAAGLKKPDISILPDQFLAEVRGLKHQNVAAELLEKLLNDEIKVRSRRNLVQSQLFSDKLKATLNAYHNRAIATHEVIEELIRLAKEMDAATKRGEEPGLTDNEIAFYDALATNESAIQAMGDDKLKVIAAELIKMVRKSVTIDWNLRDGARAKIRVIVKRILNKWGYPPDLQEEAVKTVLQQAELLCADWMGE